MIDIIPAIDVIDGRCVRLTKGDYSLKTIYADDPLDAAKRFEDSGCHRLHLVDLDGAKSSHIVNYRTLERIATYTGLVIDFGGGLKSDDDLRIAFESGAAMVTGGSIAVKDPGTMWHWIDRYGADLIILGADTRDGKISTSGWSHDSDLDIVPFISDYVSRGIRWVISTDINVDGTLGGPSVQLYRRIMDAVPSVNVIASGGVGDMDDILALDDAGLPAVIVGKAIYEGRIGIDEILKFNLNRQ
ncbi:MAG: 1-(5-phosphoribosyl)-5-[(5-phosphoribosylamino)methylideneamino] imidazole-4-carboxamide isomerase [Pseudoflavonifractor sp.]|nr:1-(5-phosphoribosyl)-5-[(5-phosphoribosylamino)methylideneamino] imidazole-4-carboxamide isomerase [Pseudoflavonifractor sp.]